MEMSRVVGAIVSLAVAAPVAGPVAAESPARASAEESVWRVSAGWHRPIVTVGQGVAFEVGEGQRALVSGTELAVDLVQVRNLTAQGCLGGPIGCRDSAELVVTRGQESRGVILYLPRNQGETEQGVNRVRLFGHVIRLVALPGNRARLEIAASPD